MDGYLVTQSSKYINFIIMKLSPLLDPFDNMTVQNWFTNYEFQTLTQKGPIGHHSPCDNSRKITAKTQMLMIRHAYAQVNEELIHLFLFLF